jgi:hypothetical protein
MPASVVLGLLLCEIAVLAGGLWWTFRRAQMPVGVRGSLGLAALVALSQALLMMVVQTGLDWGADSAARVGTHPLNGELAGGTVAVGLLAGCVAAPLALQRYLRLDARWTRTLSRELVAGSIASGFAVITVFGVAFFVFGLAFLLLRGL